MYNVQLSTRDPNGQLLLGNITETIDFYELHNS